MRLPDSIDVTGRKRIPNTWAVVERIRRTLKLSDAEIADMLLITPDDLKNLKERGKDISANRIFSLAERLNLGFDTIMSGQIDYQALHQHFSGNKTYLPERYQKAALSRRRTTLFILNYIEKNYGWRERLSILHHFQLNEAIFANPDEPISFQFASDLCEFLYRYKLGEAGLAQIGVESFLSANTVQVKQELADCSSVGEIYERMCSTLIHKYFERNFIYRVVKMDHERCTVSATPNSQLIEMLGSKSIVGNPATAIVRRGIAAAYPAILGLPTASVHQSACVYQGDREIRYEIDFSRAKRALSWN